MSRPLISSENPLWRNIAGFLIAIIVVPLVIILKLIILPFERPMKRAPEEVVKYLQDFVDGTGGGWDWDDFTSCPISDHQLEALRIRACNVELPVTDDGLAELRKLLAEAKRIYQQQSRGE